MLSSLFIEPFLQNSYHVLYFRLCGPLVFLVQFYYLYFEVFQGDLRVCFFAVLVGFLVDFVTQLSCILLGCLL